MNSTKKNIQERRSWLGFFIFAFILIWFLIANFKASQSVEFFKSQLKDFNCPQTITLHGIHFNIKNNKIYFKNIGLHFPIVESKIYTLLYYYKLTQIKPIFSLAGIDPEKTAREVEKMKILVKETKKLFPKKERATIEKGLRPINFLSDLSPLEKARIAFLNKPSYKNLKKYNLLLEKTINDYIKDLNNYQEAFKAQEQLGDFILLERKTSAQIVFQKLKELEKQAKEIKRNFEQNLKCLDGEIENCQYLKHTFTEIGNLLKEEKNQILPFYQTNIPREQEKQEKEIFAFVKKAYEDSQEVSFPSNLKIEISTPCFLRNRPARFVFSLINSNLNPIIEENNVLQPRLISQLYFTKLEGRTSPYYQPLIERGDKLYWNEETSYYFCPDLEYSLTISTIGYIRNFLKENPIFRNNPNFSNLASEEKKIVGLDTVSQLQVVSYFQEANRLLITKSEKELLKLLNPAQIKNLEHLILVYISKTGNFYQNLQSSNIQLRWVLTLREIATKRKELSRSIAVRVPFLILIRSYPALFFLSANKTIILSQPSFSLPALRTSRARHYCTWDETKKTYSKKEVLKFMKDSVKIYQYWLEKAKLK